MVCIYCSSKTQVINSRAQKRLNHTWRRRECSACHAIFTTEEAADYSSGLLVRSVPTISQPFSRDTLFISILKSLGHRQSAIDDAGALSATIIAKLLARTHEAVINPLDITSITYETLRNFDTAAAVQYAAYHPGTNS